MCASEAAEPSAGENAGEAGEPSAGEAAAPSAGEAGEPSAGEAAEPSAGEATEPSAGEAGELSTGEAGEPSAGEACAWRGIVPLRSEGACASALGEGWTRGTLAPPGKLAAVPGALAPSVLTTGDDGLDAVALATKALAVSEGAAWSGMMLTGKVLAKWCTEEGAEVARPAVELATVVSKETGGSAVEGEMARRPAAAAAAVGRRVADVEAMLAAVWCAGGTEPIVSKMTDDEVVGLTERVLDAQWMDSV